MRPLVPAVTVLALLLGCTPDRPKLPSMPAAFATIPLPPLPEYLGQAGSEDALMFTFRSAMKSDSVTAYYEQLFRKDTIYKVVGSTDGAAGEHAFYVEYHRRPLWVRIRPEAGNEGSIVELTGAVVSPGDTIKVSDTSKAVHGTGIVPAPTPAPRRSPSH